MGWDCLSAALSLHSHSYWRFHLLLQNTVVDILPICHSVPAGPTLEICGEVVSHSTRTALALTDCPSLTHSNSLWLSHCDCPILTHSHSLWLPHCDSLAGPVLSCCFIAQAEKLSSGNNQKVLGLYYASAAPSQKEKPVFLQGLLRNLKTILSGDAVFLQANHALLADNTKVFLEVSLALSLSLLGLAEVMLAIVLFLPQASTVDGQRLERRILGEVLDVNQGLNHLLRENKANVFADYEDHVNSSGSADFTNKELSLWSHGLEGEGIGAGEQ